MVPIQGTINMSKSLLKPGEHVWIPDEQHSWLAANIISIGEKDDDVVVEVIDTGKSRTLSKSLFNSGVVLPRNATLGEDRIDDLTGLAFLHEASVLNTIKSRYDDGSIYTYSGIVLAAVNPYCRQAIYEREVIWAYNKRQREELSPHLFAIAEDALRSMCQDAHSQSIIVSGESGAGKTISAKYIMRYFAEVCAAGTPTLLPMDELTVHELKQTTVEDRVLATNPILEAFGNAKTIRNDNSSRFGKYVQIFFTDRNSISGAAIKTYLLEKTRVVMQAKEERSFHIFYQLLAGCPETERNELHLGNSWDEYHYLHNSKVGTIDGVDDKEEFEITRSALGIAGFSEMDQWNIFRTLAGILHFGNVDFIEDSDGHAQIKDANDDPLAISSGLLGVSREDLMSQLLLRKIIAGHEEVEVYNSKAFAIAARDSFAKFLYSSLFDHIVQGLNSNLLPKEEEDREKFIGVLDIYGFEKFDHNSFEQFCINYANEKLQNLFNKHVFDLEQKLYLEEGIDWSFVQFYDNQHCIDLIEAKLGILDLLDEECRFPNGTDVSFVAKLYDKHHGKTMTDSNTGVGSFLLRSKVSEVEKFTVKHFAYDVEYTANSFIEKNRDQVPNELFKTFSVSNNEFVRDLVINSSKATTAGASMADSRDSLNGQPGQKNMTKLSMAMADSRDSLLSGRGQGQKSATKPSTGMSFKLSLSSLMKVISSTRAHYIRCIKPNERKEPMYFDSPFVVQQLQACGILETVRISSAGYPGRWPFSEFISRFKMLSNNPCHISTIEDDRNACLHFLEESKMASDQFQVGRTRVFMRAGVLAALEEARTAKLYFSALQIQSIHHTFDSQKFLIRSFKAALLLTCSLRRLAANRRFRQLLEHESSIGIQRFFRVHLERLGLLLAIESSTRICTIYKVHSCRKNSKEFLKITAVKLICHYYLVFLSKRDLMAAIHIGLAIQSRYRRSLAWTHLFKLKEEAKSVGHLEETLEVLKRRISELTQQLKLADEHLEYERQVNAKLRDELKQQEEKEENQQVKPHLTQTESDLEEAQKRIKSFEDIIESLENANNDLFDRNEELAKQIRVYRLEKMNAERLATAKSSYNHQSLANIILRDTETPPQSMKHMRFLSVDSNIALLSELDLPSITRPVMIQASAADREDIKLALDDPGCLAELLHVVESARIPRTPDERAMKSVSRIPCRLFERWILSWLQIGSNSTVVKSYLERLLGHVKLNCMSINNGQQAKNDQTSSISSDRKLAFWIANLFDFLCFLQWAVEEEGCSDGDLSDGMSDRMLILLQLRTDVARVVEELYRAWLTDLFRLYSRSGVTALLDYQGLTGFSSDRPTRTPTTTITEMTPTFSLKMFMLPFAKSAAFDGASRGQQQYSIDDLIESLEELTDSMESSHLQSEIVIQLLCSVISNFSSAAFNQLLLRKNFASWKRGIQIQYNLSRIEEWANVLEAKLPGYFFAISSPTVSIRETPTATTETPTTTASHSLAATTTSPLIQIEPLIQAVKLLQLAKTRVATDLDVLLEACPRLNLAQVRKILSVYVPDAYEDGPVSPEILRSITMRIQQQQYELKDHLVETLPEPLPQNLPLQLSIKPVEPTPFSSLPTAAVPPHLWKIFALVDSKL